MADRVKYLSAEWRDEAERRLTSELAPERMKNLTSSMSNIYLNCPNGEEKYLFFRFENGNLEERLVGEREPPEAEFRISGDYATFAMISRAELGSQKALMNTP